MYLLAIWREVYRVGSGSTIDTGMEGGYCLDVGIYVVYD